MVEHPLPAHRSDGLDVPAGTLSSATNTIAVTRQRLGGVPHLFIQSPTASGPKRPHRARPSKGGLRAHVRDCAVMSAVALPAGYALARIGAPVPWLLGPLLAGAGLAFATHRPWSVPRPVYSGAQVILGVAIGLTFPPNAFAVIGPRLPALAALVLLTAALSLCNGFLLSRWAGVDQASGFLGSVPGAASSMVVMSGELGADAWVVTVLQYLRVTLVAVLAPLAVEHVAPRLITEAASRIAAPTAAADFQVWHLAWITVYALLGLVLARIVRLPAGAFLGPFLAAVGGTAVTGMHLSMPGGLFACAMTVVGASVGVQFDWATVRRLGRVVLVQTGLVLGLLLAAGALGYLFSTATEVPLVTAFLGSTPGAMETMVAAAVELGADPPFVLAMQMIRFLFLLLAGPWITRRLAARFASGARRAQAALRPHTR